MVINCISVGREICYQDKKRRELIAEVVEVEISYNKFGVRTLYTAETPEGREIEIDGETFTQI